jgi:hypothetical protein
MYNAVVFAMNRTVALPTAIEVLFAPTSNTAVEFAEKRIPSSVLIASSPG